MKTRGRPQAIEWESVMPELVNIREQGATFVDCSDYIADKYDVRVSPSTIRVRMREALEESKVGRPPIPSGSATKMTEQETSSMKKSIYSFLLDHPAATLQEIADGTRLPLDAVIALHEVVKAENPGYLITPVRQRREQFSETEMVDALADAMDSLGIPVGGSMSQKMYAMWRDGLPPEEKKYFPSPLAYRRRYETWGQALEAAGLPHFEQVRDYEGTTREDAVVWLAHFLRDLRETHSYMVEATVPEYRHWLRTHPLAPSDELLRIKGVWGKLLLDAADLERNTKKLPEPRPVWTGGRKKSQRGRFS